MKNVADTKAGADLEFFRGGATNFQKKVFPKKFDDLFFRSTKLIFRALLKH